MKVFMTLPAGAPADGIKVVVEGNLLRLYFNYAKETVTTTSSDGSTIKNGDTDEDTYSAQNIDIPGGNRDYASITAAIVNDAYDINAVQAIIANKALADDSTSSITDEKRTEYKQEYKDYQAYREKAKEVATKAVEMLTAAASAEEAETAASAAKAATATTEDENDGGTSTSSSNQNSESSSSSTANS